MKRTKNYKLATFSPGDVCGATEDSRRFLTLDYNLDRYIGIIGNGIISGWEISVVSGRTVTVTFGMVVVPSSDRL
jgi:hypothetical protein